MNDISSELYSRRKYVRVLYSQEILCDTIFNPGSEEPIKISKPLKFTCVDIGMGGIGILSNNEFEIDTIFSFNLCIDSIIYEISAKVIYCIPYGEIYRVGVEFLSLSSNLEDHIKRLVARLSFSGLLSNS